MSSSSRKAQPAQLPPPPDQQQPDSPIIVAAPPAPPSLGLLAHYSSLPNREGSGFVTTLDLSAPDGPVLLQNILAGGGVSLWDLPADTIIRVEHITAHGALVTDEQTGEVTEKALITLSGPDGVFHTGSMYAFRAMQLAAMLRGAPPWRPPLAIKAIRVRSRNKRDFQSVLLCSGSEVD